MAGETKLYRELKPLMQWLGADESDPDYDFILNTPYKGWVKISAYNHNIHAVWGRCPDYQNYRGKTAVDDFISDLRGTYGEHLT